MSIGETAIKHLSHYHSFVENGVVSIDSDEKLSVDSLLNKFSLSINELFLKAVSHYVSFIENQNEVTLFIETETKKDVSMNIQFKWTNTLLDHLKESNITLMLNDTPRFTLKKETNLVSEDVLFDFQISKDKINIKYFFSSADLTSELERVMTRIVYLMCQYSKEISVNMEHFSFLSPVEKEMVQVQFNNTKSEYDLTQTFIDVFETTVKKNPKRIAVHYGNTSMTYSELNEKANSIAHMLKESGVKNNTIVGIMMNRSIESLVAILGVLKSGGAYLPLDPKQPYERLVYMVKDSEMKTLLVGHECECSKYEDIFESVNLIEVDLESLNLISNLDEKPALSDLSYIIYTSGTTGNPKGVMVEHKNLINFINWMIEIGKMSNETRMLQSFSLIFDASIIEMMPCLAAGGQICILDDSQKVNPEEILEHLAGAQALMVPSLFRAVLDYAETFNQLEKLSKFDKLYLGAEPLPTDLIAKFGDLCPNKVKDISNLYGPTESTVVASAYFYNEQSSLEEVSVGKPIGNGEIYIVKDNKLCGIGMEGELCVGGQGVTRGYLNQSALTHEKYVVIPQISDNFIYKTGDIGYWREDGTLKLLGRGDEQVKINGYRIELSEIESGLRKIEGINDAVVIYDQSEKTPLFVAFYRGTKFESTNKIKELLKKNLPCYMIPNEIIKVEEFPQTVGGKLDKKKLMVDFIDNTSKKDKSGNVNEILLVFSEVLGNREVLMEDNFFELGGDSIKAIQIISKLRQKKFELSVKDILGNKIIGKIYSKVKAISNFEVSQEEIVGPAVLSPIQQTFFEKMRINEPNYFNQSYMLESTSELNLDFIENSLNAVVKHHDLLRATYSDKGQNILPYKKDQHFGMSLVDLTHIKSAVELEEKIINETLKIQKSIDIEKGPLFKVGLFKCIDRSYLFFCIHHLSIDGISWRILVSDFIEGYETQIEGKEIALPPKTISFKEWSQYLREYGKSEQLAKEIPYWKEINSKIAAGKFRKKPQTKEFTLKTLVIELDEKYTNEILYEAGRAYNTEINDILITGLVRAIQKQTKNQTVAINMEGHGREQIHKDIKNDRTIGWFTSEYPVVVENLGYSISKDIVHIKETVRKIPNRGMGNLILQSFSPELFNEIDPDITFNYLGEFGQEYQDRVFSTSSMPKARDKSMLNAFRTPITINGLIINKNLKMEVTYEENVFETDFVQQLMNQFIEQLKEVITYCKEQKERHNTVSDFGEYDWSNEEFEKVQTKFKKKGYEISEIYPLTSMQEAMLYHKISNPNSSVYIVQMTNSVKQNIDHTLMEQSLSIIAKKYSILRTAIEHRLVTDPRQIILEDRKLEFSFVDLTNQDDKKEKFEKIKKADIRRGFDLEEDSLFRLKIIKLDEEDFKILISFHHIILDGWCSSILRNELFEIYQSLAEGISYKTLLLTEDEEDKTFSDYVSLSQNNNIVEAQKYWRELLEGFEEQIVVKPEGNPDGGDIDDVGKVEFKLSKELYEGLEEFCNTQGYTLNTVIETMWGLTLAAYTNRDDIVFGKVVSGRNVDLEGIDTMMGMFINTVPVRVKIRKYDTVSNLLNQVQEQSINTTEYDYCPLGEIQQMSSLGNELLKNAVSFENYEQYGYGTLNNKTFKLESIRELTDFNLSLGAVKGTDFYLSMMYDLNMYGESEVQRILSRMMMLLTQIIKNPGVLISELNYFEPGEEEKVLVEYNKTEDNFALNDSLVSLFEKQVISHPNNVAVEFEGEFLSYKDLNIKANSLASVLKQNGVRAGDIVPIITKPSEELVVAVLATLKAGAAYLPIDPEQPIKRIQYMINEVGATVILHGTKSLNLDSISLEIVQIRMEDIPKRKVNNLSVVVKSTDLAYVIFTSGTTGEPKGVMVNHRNSLNHTLWQIKNGDFNSESTMIQTIAFTFDGHTAELFPTLLSGGKLVIATELQRKDPSELLNLIPGNRITFIPSLLREVIAYAKQVRRTHLLSQFDKLFIVAEPITLDEVYEVIGNNNVKLNDIYHFYGPSEATVTTVSHKMSDHSIGSVIPIGKPVSNTKLYVINQFGNLCGIGMTGELCITGESVSLGYLNQPILTDEKFIPSAFEEHTKMYKTGDLVRWTIQGTIEFLGRKDNQIKLRGFRIEIQEINAALKAYKGVLDAIVIMRGQNEEKCLCAYIISKEQINIDSLRKEIAQTLPEYMLPSHIVQLEKMPTTLNGKINTSQLPDPVIGCVFDYIEPKTNTQRTLTSLFKKVLKVEQIGIKDSFYDLGGHSLKVTRLLNYIEQELQVRLTVREIMEGKTVEKISSIIDEMDSTIYYEEISVAEEVD
ncbi:amino acid adenylation domain-containing protein [Bacillus mycoides]|uniref:amino acid adenylation domain-containing protein n=1 Tax=Bacillus mycoides TaxID=1405 RepID=UPI003D1FF5AE